MKKLFVLMLALFVFAFVGCGSSDSSDDQKLSKSEIESMQRNTFRAIEMKVNELSKKQSDIFDLVVEAETTMINGEATALEMYDFVDTAETTAKSVWMAYDEIKYDDIFEDEHSEIVKSIIDDLEMSAFLHKEAYVEYKEYLDTGSLKNANAFQENISNASAYTLRADANIIKIKGELGIN